MKKLFLIISLLAGAGGFCEFSFAQEPLYIGTPGNAGQLTPGDCLKIMANGTSKVATDSGAPCGGGGGTPPLNAALLGTNSAGAFVSAPTTGTGNSVLATSPTLVTPNLGTPSALTLTNATGLPVGGIAPVNSGTIVGNPCTAGGMAAPSAISDVSCLTVLATNSVTARTLAARAAEVFNIYDYCASVCTGSAGDMGATNAVTAINSNSGGQLYYPPGLTFAVSTQHTFTTYAAWVVGGGSNTTTILTNGGGGFKWTTATSQSNGGHCGIRDIRFFQNDNATSGSQILLNNTDFCSIHDVMMGGAFQSLVLASAVATNINNLTCEGHNTTTGSMCMLLHRTNSSAGNTSETQLTNSDIRADASGTLTYAMRISDSDGFYWSNSHVGFGSAASVLIQAEFTTDQIDGVLGTNINCDTTSVGPCVDIETLAGQTGADGGNGFTGGSIANATAGGVLMNDTNAYNWKFDGVDFNSNGTYGLGVEAGSMITVVGSTFSCNNRAAGGSNHADFNGSASVVNFSGNTFSQGVGSRCTNAVAANLLVGGTTSSFNLGPNTYSGGTVNVTYSSSGTGNGSFYYSLSPYQVITPHGVQWQVTDTASTSANYLQAQGAATAVAPTLSAVGSDTNIPLWLVPKGTGGVFAEGPLTATGFFNAAASGYLGGSGSGVQFLDGPPWALFAQGSNNGIKLAPSGTGSLQAASGLVSVGTAGTISGCGTAGSVVGGAQAGTFTVGTGAGTCTFTFTINGATGTVAPHGWIINLDDVTAHLHCTSTTGGSTTTGVALCNSTVTTGDAMAWSAMGY